VASTIVTARAAAIDADARILILICVLHLMGLTQQPRAAVGNACRYARRHRGQTMGLLPSSQLYGNRLCSARNKRANFPPTAAHAAWTAGSVSTE
jgi:hypothetical protein